MTWPRALTVLLTMLPVLHAPARLAAQDTLPETAHVQRTIDHLSALVGARGDEITVSSGDMPSITAIRIGIGAANVGFEQLTDLVTTMDGDFSTTVTVPDWASPDRVHRFILFDLYFRPIALSGPFHVTDADGRVRREGRVTSDVGGCRRFVDVDEVEYALDGPAESSPDVGVDVTLTGTVREGSSCGAPFTLTVEGPGKR